MACAVDEYTGTTIGGGSCVGDADLQLQAVNPLAIWKPHTRLMEINREWTRELTEARCQVRTRASEIVDDEPCTVSVEFSYTASPSVTVIYIFQWPSGSRTIVQRTERETLLNGVAASRGDLMGFDCLSNSVTLNQFCYTIEQ